MMQDSGREWGRWRWVEGFSGSGAGRGDGLRVLQSSGDGLRADQGIGAEAVEVIGAVHGEKDHTVSK